MKCCVPLCENTSENVFKSGRITLHWFPDDPRLRAAWLRALGKEDCQLPNCAVVCSQHFLHDDVRETESGSRQLRPGAVPSTVLVCMICLATDSKMSPISQYNLEAAYEKLTGHPLWDGGNLKQALCVQCAQRLRNFNRFTEQSLRARSLMMELLEKHELITMEHIKMIQHANKKQQNYLVSTTLGLDTCDMDMVENTNEGKQTDSEEAVLGVGVKSECSDDSRCVDESIQAINEENSLADCVSEEFNEDLIKYESDVFMCTVCSEEFPHEHAYSAHVHMHLYDDAHPAAPSAHSAVAQLSARLAINTSNIALSHSERALVTNSGASDKRALESDHRTNTDLNSCVVVLYDIFKYPQNAEIKTESSPQIMPGVSSRGSLNAHTACEDAQYRAASEDEVAATHNEPAASVLSETEPGTSGHSSHSSRAHTFTCDVCQCAFTRRNNLIIHFRTHTGEKPYSCEICSYKSTNKNTLVRHMRTHTGVKPYSCKICNYKCTQKGQLVRHMMTHTGEKPYSCKLCSYKCTEKGTLMRHMRIHTGEKPYACKLCCYKCTVKGKLARHIKSHTGEKPYSCKICSYKCTEKGTLIKHMRIHTGEKPYSCKICSYKFTEKGTLIKHMRIHTGEKPYSCKLCCYKCTHKGQLNSHMWTHTGEKPYSCEICSYKFTQKGHLVRHMRIHTGEKPYSCKICSFKCTQKGTLMRHNMRIHTGEKPYSCKLCCYKCTEKSILVCHMRTHTGEKPYSCRICSYKCTKKGNLVCHMRIHTGEKPYSCKLCCYKCIQKGQLNSHLRTHKT